MVQSAKLRNLVASDEGGALLVDDHVKDPCPLSPSPLPRVNGQFFQIVAAPPPKRQNFFVDMVTLALSTIILAFRTWKPKAIKSNCGSECCTRLVPVVLATLGIFFSYVMYVYMKFRPHAGTEIALKEISKKMYTLDCPRKIIKAVRNDYGKCRIISKKTLETEMANHHQSWTTLCPLFYNVQMDIVYGC